MKSLISGTSAFIFSRDASVLLYASLNSVLPALLSSIDQSGKLVGSLDVPVQLFVVILQDIPVIRPEVIGQMVEEPVFSDRFHLFVGAADLIAVILYRRRHIAGDDLRGIVVHGDQGCFFTVQVFPVADIADQAERMRDHCRLEGMLAEVLRSRAAHQRPAFDIFHAGKDREEMIVHHSPSIPV